MIETSSTLFPHIQIEQVQLLDNEDDLHALCEALEASILEGNHCKWIKPPPRHLMENYLRGVLLVPGKLLFLARLDGNIVGACEINLPPKEQDSSHIGATIFLFAVAPYAQNMGIEVLLLEKVEQTIRHLGCPIINITINETQKTAFDFYTQHGYRHWGTHPCYQRIKGQIVRGLFLYKSFLNI